MARTDADRAPVMMRRTQRGLEPLSGFDAERLDSVAIGSVVEVGIKQRRSTQQNRLYWSILSKVVENVDGYPTSERLHDALKLHLGYSIKIKSVTGHDIWLPDSTAFSKMDGVEFKFFFDRALAVLADLIGCDPMTLVNEAQKEVA